MPLTLRCNTFGDGEPIPQQYTQDGKNVSPPLAWEGAPEKTAEYALIVDDPDAPRDEPWVHWVLYNIPPNVDHLPEGIPKGAQPPMPAGALQGANTGGNVGYDGPAPPKGHGTHHYHFKLCALDEALGLQPGLEKTDLLDAVEGHVLEQAELVGTYER
jgi:hypothetical protein